MKNAVIKIEKLSHRYTTQWAVKNIQFEIDKEGIVGLLGSNGAGKSTLMNIICGVLKQTEGEVFINGVDLKKHPVEAKKNIGFLPQKPPLYLDFTVKEYLTYCANLHAVERSRIKSAVEEAAERCGVAHFMNRLLRNLSGGYQQRTGIAQAIVHNPRFVVLDEPTNGLDPNQIVEVRGLIKDIAKDRSILLSTHILSEVQATCMEIKMIENGELVFSGTLDAFNNYIQPNTLLLTLDTPPEGQEAFLAVEGVKAAEKLAFGHFRLHYDGEVKTIKQLAQTSVKNEWGLIGLSVEKSSLDVVFAELSKTTKKITP